MRLRTGTGRIRRRKTREQRQATRAVTLWRGFSCCIVVSGLGVLGMNAWTHGEMVLQDAVRQRSTAVVHEAEDRYHRAMEAFSHGSDAVNKLQALSEGQSSRTQQQLPQQPQPVTTPSVPIPPATPLELYYTRPQKSGAAIDPLQDDPSQDDPGRPVAAFASGGASQPGFVETHAESSPKEADRNSESALPKPVHGSALEPARSSSRPGPKVKKDTRPLHLQPPIIVGGTDGSGTRGCVTLLLSMNVLMLSDAGNDGGCQYDVHGKEMHREGWPPVVNPSDLSTH